MKAVQFVLSLPVADLEKSLAFYRDDLGFETPGIEENMITLELPGLSLFLIDQNEFSNYTSKVNAIPKADKNTVGSVLTFGLKSRDELTKLLQKAKAAGAKIAGPATESWGTTAYFTDPDGHLWELVWNQKMDTMPELQGAKNIAPEAKSSMLIRKPVAEVFAAFKNPEVMSKFWFTYSSGPIQEGKTITWKWEMYGAEGDVQVKQVRGNEFVAFTWNVAGNDILVEITFEERAGNTTLISVRESGYNANDPNITDLIAGQTGGWAFVLSALKAYLEHNIILNVVHDHAPNSLVKFQK